MARMTTPVDCIFCTPDPCTCQGSTSTRARKVAKPAVKKQPEPVLQPEPAVEPEPVVTAPAPARRSGLRSIKTLATVIPRPAQIVSQQQRPSLPKPDPKPTGAQDEMTVAIARLALGGLVETEELRKHRGELMLTDSQFAALEEEVIRRNAS